MILANDVVVRYAHETIRVKRFEAKKGEFITILGPNGGGKTTFIKAILGLIDYEGSIKVFGKEARNLSKEDKKRIGYLPQFSFTKVDFPITVKEVIEMGGEPSYIKELGLKGILNKLISEVSGGERQRALIARALASDPDLIILDEPESSLDAKWWDRVVKLLKELNKKGKTIVVISHDTTVMLPLSTKLACINKDIFVHGKKEFVLPKINEVYGCEMNILMHGNKPHKGEKHIVVKKHD